MLAELTGIEVTYKTSTKEYIYFSSVILISQEVFVFEKKGEEERQKHTRKRERERDLTSSGFLKDAFADCSGLDWMT